MIVKAKAAFQAGAKVRFEGGSLSENHHDAGTVAYSSWVAGWCDEDMLSQDPGWQGVGLKWPAAPVARVPMRVELE